MQIHDENHYTGHKVQGLRILVLGPFTSWGPCSLCERACSRGSFWVARRQVFLQNRCWRIKISDSSEFGKILELAALSILFWIWIAVFICSLFCFHVWLFGNVWFPLSMFSASWVDNPSSLVDEDCACIFGPFFHLFGHGFILLQSGNHVENDIMYYLGHQAGNKTVLQFEKSLSHPSGPDILGMILLASSWHKTVSH